MTRAPLILGLDTSAAYCAAALVTGDKPGVAVGEDMARGQAERLMDLLEEVLAAEGHRWADLDALAVGVGPGNFTGIRIGVAAARALALALEIPAYGVTGFAARGRLAPPGTTVAIPAPRAQVYVLTPEGPALCPHQDVERPAPDPAPAALAEAIALEGAARWPAEAPAPAPYYARAPDAAPPRDAAPPLLP